MANRPVDRYNFNRGTKSIPQYQRVDYTKVKAKIDNKGTVIQRNKNLEADNFERQRRARILQQKEERRKFEVEQRTKRQQEVQIQQKSKDTDKHQGQGEGRKSKEEPPKKFKDKIRFYSHKLAKGVRNKWRFFQGYYPPSGGPPELPSKIYEPSAQQVKDTTYARQLAAAMDIRIIRYPEPFAGLLLTSHYLEPKNYKVMVNRKSIFYSYDYTPYIPEVSHYVQQFSQIILDSDDRVTVYVESSKFPNEVRCLTSCLNCRKCTCAKDNNEFVVHAPNGFVLGKIVRKRLKRYGGFLIGFDIYDKSGARILRIKKHCFLKKRNFRVVGPDKKIHVATIYRKIIHSKRDKQFPNHCDFRILLKVAQSHVEVKLLLIGATFFIVCSGLITDYLLDKCYRPFFRFGSSIVPTFSSRYSQ